MSIKNIKYPLIIIFLTIILILCEKPKYTGIEDIKETKEISIKTYMCKTNNCEEVYIHYINNAKTSIYCAFFDFDLEKLNNAIRNINNTNDKNDTKNKNSTKDKNISKLILVDGDNNDFFNDSYLIYDKRSAFMHNKFCIIDNHITITGSFNPTINGRDKNDNNIIIIQSIDIAEIYTTYFKELVKEQQLNQKHNMTKNYNMNFNSTNITLCFSRDGNCLKKINQHLKLANQSIYFMLFTITDQKIANTLLIKHYSNTTIKGIFEKSLITKYSSYHILSYHNLSVKKDCNPGKLHHKVFIIDNKTVITGSMNPSHNADNNNDENVIIIENKNIASHYLKEFERISKIC